MDESQPVVLVPSYCTSHFFNTQKSKASINGTGRADQSGQIKFADVVTMDIILPGMNGIEATRQIKMLYPQIKIVMVSALGGELREQAAAAGADGYVPKELAHEALVDSVADVVSK